MTLPNVDGVIAAIPEPAAPAAPGVVPPAPGVAPALKPMFGYSDEFEKAYPKKK